MDCTQKWTFSIVLFLAIVYLGNSQFKYDRFTDAVECIAETKNKVLCRHLLRCNYLLSEENVDVLNQCVEEQLPEVFPDGVTRCPQKVVDSSERENSNVCNGVFLFP
ncbi:hypothetical protein TNCT_382331 [Trichonephila clavata]|uniref:Uncharacterized protein n=1 Tax=Trichonephila clavata TaxID=2740835 RepID=A0A8X6L6J5_TRICU|nr:hypothetical protein TNCT_382331 [Trichonephila clavata]